MLSYNNDENLKKLIVYEMRKHQEQDQLVKDTYCLEEGGKFKGCAVGCAIDSINIALGKRYLNSDHKVFEEELGIPEWLAHIQDSLFEALPIGDNSQFAVDFLEAIPVGVNLEPLKWKFCAFLMRKNIERVLTFSKISGEIRDKILITICVALFLHEKAIETGSFDYNEAKCSIESIALSDLPGLPSLIFPPSSSSKSAMNSFLSTIWSARSSCSSVADAAAFSAVWSARSAYDSEAAYKRYSVELIRLLKEAK